MAITNEDLDRLLKQLTFYIDGNFASLAKSSELFADTSIENSNEVTKRYAQIICTALFDLAKKKKAHERIKLAHQIQTIMTRDKKNSDGEERRKILKECFQAEKPSINWRDNLLGINLHETACSFFEKIRPNKNAHQEVEITKDRFISTTDQAKLFSIFAGSSFITLSSESASIKEQHVLDAAYVRCPTNPDSPYIIMSVADGCGGHHKQIDPDSQHSSPQTDQQRFQAEQADRESEFEDLCIARSAHFATKHCSRLFALYDTPELLNKNMSTIINSVADELNQKALIQPTANTTLLCARAFPSKNGYHITGINIGDGMLIAFDPNSKTIRTIAPAHAAIVREEDQQEATAGFPNACKSEEIHLFNETVGKNSILIALTDGYLDNLPTKQERKVYPSGLPYIEISIDAERMNKELSNSSNHNQEDGFLTTLTTITLKDLNTQRLKLVEASKKPGFDQIPSMGDDLLALSLTLPDSDEPSNTQQPKNCCIL